MKEGDLVTKTQRMVGMFLSAAVIVGAVGYGMNKLTEDEQGEQFINGASAVDGVPIDGEGNTVIVNNGHSGGLFSGFFGPFGPFGPFGYFSGRSSGYNQGVSTGTSGSVKSPTAGTTTVTPDPKQSNPGVVGTSPWGKPSTGSSSGSTAPSSSTSGTSSNSSSSFSSSSKSSSGISSGISGSSHGGIGSSGGSSIS